MTSFDIQTLFESFEEIETFEKKNIKLVKNKNTGELFVLKELPAYLYSVYMQLKETSIEGVPKCFECVYDEEAGKIYVLEEYIHGKNLKQMLSEAQTLPEPLVIKIAVELSQILKRIQGLSPAIIHRDIKPSNIILSDDDKVYLIDFSAARNIDEQETEDTRLLGTQYFAAPEQYGFGQSDLRTDIYGFGATINYLLTRKKPNESRAVSKLSNVLKVCLSIDPDKRFQNAEELCIGIKNATDNAGNPVKQAIFNMKSRLNANRKKIHSSYRRFLPPGFRLLNPACMLLTTAFLAFAMLVVASFTVEDPDIVGYYLLVYRLAVAIMIFGGYLWFGNYLDVWRRFPLMNKNPIVTFIMTFLYYGVFLTIVLLITSVLSSI